MARPEYKDRLGEKRYVASGSHINGADDTCELSVEWRNVKDIVTTSDHIFVVLHTAGFILPRDQLTPEIERIIVDRGSALPGSGADDYDFDGVIAQVVFMANAGDAAAAVAPMFRLSQRHAITSFVFGVVVTVAVFMVRGRELLLEPLALICAAALGGALSLGLTVAIRWESRRRYTRHIANPGETRVALTADDVRVQTPRSSERVEWASVGAVRREPGAILFDVGPSSLFVPRRAFHTEAEFQDFALVALKLHDEHRPAA